MPDATNTPLTVSSEPELGVSRIALIGNPNTGKTTLFNRLTGLRHHTSNFPGTTVDARVGTVRLPLDGGQWNDAELVDLPGIYSLELDQTEAEICRGVLAGRQAPKGERVGEPDAVALVLDATNMGRNLVMAGEVLRRRLPTLVCVNMMDRARRAGLSIDADKLTKALGTRVVLISARSGEGVDGLRAELANAMCDGAVPTRTPPGDDLGLRAWADEVFSSSITGPGARAGEALTDKLDRALTHPLLGSLLLIAVMGGLFWSLFALARFPMEWISGLFGWLGTGVAKALPPGLIADLLKDGVIAGVGSTLVFLPQICLLFFLISLLEDTGYLARAALLMDRVLRPFGLPGHAFVPLLSSHACALPGIMSTRTIPDRRERLATILVAPFMTCSARLPVYVLLTGLLFPDSPGKAALAFVACYALGIAAGVLSALIARRTILRGPARPMAIELPSYKLPSLRTALLTTYDRGWTFIKNAGTNILCICLVLWWLGAFPRVQPPARVAELRTQAAQVQGAAKDDLISQADRLEHTHAKGQSFIGKIGRTVQPVFEPLGFDWQLSVGVMASFAAREVFVGTMSILVAGEEKSDDNSGRITDQLRSARRDDGKRLIFDGPTSWALLVYYVLAMQCLPTLVVTAKESGSYKWAMIQLAWMSLLAYVAGAIVYALARAWGA